MSRDEAYLNAMLRQLSAPYYQTLHGEGTASDVARAVTESSAAGSLRGCPRASRPRRAAYGVLHRPDRRGQRIEPMQDAAERGKVTMLRRGDCLLGRRREPVQPDLEERPGTRVGAAVPGGGKCGAAGRAHLGNDRPGRPADLGRGRHQSRLDPAEHVQLEQVRLAPHLVIAYLVVGSHGNSAPFISRHA